MWSFRYHSAQTRGGGSAESREACVLWPNRCPIRYLRPEPTVRGLFQSAMERLHRPFPERMEGWEWIKLLHPDDVDEISDTWHHSLSTGAPFQMEHRFRQANGNYRWHLTRPRRARCRRKYIDVGRFKYRYRPYKAGGRRKKTASREQRIARSEAERASQSRMNFSPPCLTNSGRRSTRSLDGRSSSCRGP